MKRDKTLLFSPTVLFQLQLQLFVYYISLLSWSYFCKNIYLILIRITYICEQISYTNTVGLKTWKRRKDILALSQWFKIENVVTTYLYWRGGLYSATKDIWIGLLHLKIFTILRRNQYHIKRKIKTACDIHSTIKAYCFLQVDKIFNTVCSWSYVL